MSRKFVRDHDLRAARQVTAFHARQSSTPSTLHIASSPSLHRELNNAICDCLCKAHGDNLPRTVDGISFSLPRTNRQGSLATTSLITVPAVVNIASSENANESWQLIQQRVDMMTVLCGTVSTATFALTFCFGSRRHPYLLYMSTLAALLLRNQRQTVQSLGRWLKDEYYLAKDFLLDYSAHKSHRRPSNSRANRPSNRPSRRAVQEPPPVPLLPPDQLTLALEKLGASSLTNCFLSGIAFALATIGVFGDMD